MILYHVTKTESVESIRKRGLLRFMPSNWVKQGNGERYGNGEIFAFEHRHDALRWAARMDWELNKKTGSGKISIVKFHGFDTWKLDHADPLSQAGSKGRWLKSTSSVHHAYIIEVKPIVRQSLAVLKGVTNA